MTYALANVICKSGSYIKLLHSGTLLHWLTWQLLWNLSIILV